MKNKQLVYALIGVTLVTLLPYVLAAILAGPEHVFTGFIFNSGDGATYLAKMRAGYDGDWQFRLSYTADPGEGTYVYLFYLFLGNLARVTGLSIQGIYHLARAAGAWFLIWSLYRFFFQIFSEKPEQATFAFLLSVFGSGMGWMALHLSQPTSDFWVAEAYPFLSMLTNAHFPTGLALILVSFTLLIAGPAKGRNIKLMLAGLLLSIIMPFGVVNLLFVAVVWVVWEWVNGGRSWQSLHWQPLFSLGSLGGPYLLYQYWVLQTHPVLSGWNAQNIMISPPVWDLLLSFSPAIFLAAGGLIFIIRRPLANSERLLITWLLVGLLLIYLPTTLQRRFMLGLYIPVVGLAVFGIKSVLATFPLMRRRIIPIVFGLAVPTNILLILLSIFGILSHSPAYYLQRDEDRALRWLRDQAPNDCIVLASPELSQWVPGWTGCRVIYGHPLETVNAEQEEAWVYQFYQEKGSVDIDLLSGRGIDYVVLGPREREIGGGGDYSALPVVYQSGQVQLLAVEEQP